MVPLADFLQQLVKVLGGAPLLELLPAAAGPVLHAGGEKDLYFRLGQHHCTNVPAIHHHTALPGHIPLHIHQKGPHLRDSGHPGGIHGDLRKPDLLRYILPVEVHPLEAIAIVPHGNFQLRQKGADLLLCRRINPLFPGTVAHCAVNSAGIHIDRPQLPGNTAGQGALARSTGTVNGHGKVFFFFHITSSLPRSVRPSGLRRGFPGQMAGGPGNL